MKILVTGVTGFIGSALARRAIAAGHTVAGLVRPGSGIRPCDGDVLQIEGTFADAPWDAIDAFQPDALVHLAWIATPGVYLESPQNLDWVKWSLDFVRRARKAGVGYVLGAGTCIEYRIDGQVLSEARTPLKPVSLYARCKHELREQLEEEAEGGGFAFGWGRVFYPYGPGEHPARLCSSIMEKLSGDERIVLKTPDSTKDYIHIDDLAAAILLTLEQGVRGPINWGTGTGITVKEIADTIADIMEKPGLVEAAVDATPDPLGHVVADASRLRGLGWSPQVSLEEGLRQLYASLMASSLKSS